MKPGLERIRALLEALGNPHAGLRGVLIAGTNGKGSVCAVVDSIVRAAGLRAVTLTKPHLRSYCERIAVDGEPIAEDRFSRVIENVWSAAETLGDQTQPTAFEILTAAGLLVAGQESPDIVVCEVGLGGRLDSTNVVDLGVAVVTNVGLDHRDRLGDTIEEIAKEKAAIIKPGDAVVTAAQPPALAVVRARAHEVGATLGEVGDVHGRADSVSGVQLTMRYGGHELRLRAPLVGEFQLTNVATAVATCHALRLRGFPIGPAAVQRGCARVTWPARMQWFATHPPVLLDGAHNPPGIAALVRAARPLLHGRRVVVVFAAMRDKDVAAMAHELESLAAHAIVVTAPDVVRSTPPTDLAAVVGERAVVRTNSAEALECARRLAGEHGVVLVCGSLYLAGEVLALLEGG